MQLGVPTPAQRRNERGWPIASSYLSGAESRPGGSVARRLIAVFWGGINMLASMSAGVVAYFATVTVVLPEAGLDMAAWLPEMARRWLFLLPPLVAMTLGLHGANRALFGWVHAGEAPPEPRAFLRLFVAAVVVGLAAGSGESLFVNAL